MDDEWLTSSFFLTLTREQLDKVCETLSESNGSAGELNTQKMLIDSYANTAVSRDKVLMKLLSVLCIMFGRYLSLSNYTLKILNIFQRFLCTE